MIEETQTQRWCYGWRSTGTRRLAEDELESLRRQKIWFVWQAWLALGAVPAGMGVAFLFDVVVSWALQKVGMSKDLSTLFGTLPLIFVWLLGIPVAILIFRDKLRKASGLKKDIGAGVVERFEGIPAKGEELSAVPPSVAALLKIESTETQWLEVLPHADLVYRVNGERPAKWTAALAGEAALPAQEGMTSPVDEDFFADPRDSAKGFRQRHMMEAEKAEVRGQARRMLRTPWHQYAFMILMGLVCLGILVDAMEGMRRSWGEVLLRTLQVAATVFVYKNFVDRVVLRRRMKQDVEAGIIFQAPGEREGEGMTEFLPSSGLIWSIGGKPARWRMPWMEERHPG